MERGRELEGEMVIKAGFPPALVGGEVKDSLGTALARCSLPDVGGGAEVRWAGPWTAERDSSRITQ